MAMQGYTKVFNSILVSTIWMEPSDTRIIWITMLAMSDKDGVVSASIPGLASIARTSMENCESALKKLLAPDPYSRSKDFNGRRIEEIDGGWRILNYEKYKKKMSAEERREYLTNKQREYRERDRLVSLNTDVDKCNDSSTKNTHSDSDSDTNKKKQEKPTPCASAQLSVVPIPVWQSFVEHRKRLRAPLTPHAGDLIQRKLEQFKLEGHDPVAILEQSIERGWKGVFEVDHPNGAPHARSGPSLEAQRKMLEEKIRGQRINS